MDVITPFEPGVVGSSNTDRSAPNANGDATMGKDQFLKMLVTQLRNQDPLNPMDGQEFAAQLAQFTSVEQLLNISDVLAHNGDMNALLAQSVNSGVAAGLIGKSVQAVGNTVNWDGENAVPINFELADAAEVVSVTIRNEAGLAVRTFELTGRSSGDHSLEWDGLDASGSNVAAGSFTYEVSATDVAGNSVEAQSYVRGKVDRITFGQDGIMLWIGKIRVPMSDVESVE
jgi:flagellar basal-body rod modification protein FlgD